MSIAEPVLGEDASMRNLLSRRALAPLVLLAVLAGGCSHDSGGDSAGKAKPTTTTTIRTLKADEVDASASEYCKAWADIRAVGAAPLTGNEAKDTEVRKTHYAKLVPLAERLRKVAPAEIAAAVDFAVKQMHEIASSGSDQASVGAEAQKRQQELAKYALDHCTKQPQ
jgi:hypothetical protein